MIDQRHKRDYGRGYGWDEAQSDLAAGLHPEVVAARIGEPISYLLEVADERGWPVTWNGRRFASRTPDFDA